MFELTIESTFTMGGRGTVLVGTLAKGRISIGDRAILKTRTREVPCTVAGVETLRKMREFADPGQDVGVLCREIECGHLTDCTLIEGDERRVVGAFLVSAPRRWWEFWREE